MKTWETMIQAVQANPNGETTGELINRLCDHAVSYAESSYELSMPHETAYDIVIDGYLGGYFDGTAQRLINYVRHRVDSWAAEAARPPREVGFEVCLDLDSGADMDMFELGELIAGILARLPSEQQQVVRLCVMENQSERSVARRLGSTKENVTTIKNKALRELRRPEHIRMLRGWGHTG